MARLGGAMDQQAAADSADGTVDALTGLETREALDAALVRETAFARRHALQLALFLVDLDGLKAVNAAHGEQVGDRLLAAVGRALKAHVAHEVALARVGGEVFGVLLRGLDAAGAEKEAEGLRGCVAQVSVPGAQGPVQVTASVGVAIFHSARAATPEVLMYTAEHALLEAKKQGRNRTHLKAEGLPAPAPTPPV